MRFVINAGEYDKRGTDESLATPQASKMLNVYGLPVGVFILTAGDGQPLNIEHPRVYQRTERIKSETFYLL